MQYFLCVLTLLLACKSWAAIDWSREKIPEIKGIDFGKFVAPNEWQTYLLAPTLKGKSGALIGVGTLRVLYDAALGDFSDVILLDYDQAATAFNQANIELLKLSRDRFDYLARLFRRSPDKQIRQLTRIGTIDGKAYVEALMRSPRTPLGQLWSAQKTIDSIIPHPQKNSRGPTQSIAKGFELAIKKMTNFSEQWKMSIFGSDLAFDKVQRLARDGAIVAFNGDLAGKTTLRKIGAVLKKNGVKLSVLDISNSSHHISESQSKKRALKFAENLSVLPWANDALMITTLNTDLNGAPEALGVPPVAGDHWIYLPMEPAQIEKAARAGYFDDVASYFELHKELLTKKDLEASRDPQLLILKKDLTFDRIECRKRVQEALGSSQSLNPSPKN